MSREDVKYKRAREELHRLAAELNDFLKTAVTNRQLNSKKANRLRSAIQAARTEMHQADAMKKTISNMPLSAESQAFYDEFNMHMRSFKEYAYKTLDDMVDDVGNKTYILPYSSFANAKADNFSKFGLDHYFPLNSMGHFIVTKGKGKNRKVVSFANDELTGINQMRVDMVIDTIEKLPLTNDARAMVNGLRDKLTLEDLNFEIFGKQSPLQAELKALGVDIDSIYNTSIADLEKSEYQFNVKGVFFDSGQNLSANAKETVYKIVQNNFYRNLPEIKKLLKTVSGKRNLNSVQWWGHGQKSEATVDLFYKDPEAVIREYIYSTVKKRHMEQLRRDAKRISAKSSPAVKEYIKDYVEYVTGGVSKTDIWFNRLFLRHMDNKVLRYLDKKSLNIMENATPATAINNRIKSLMNILKLGFRPKAAMLQLTQPIATAAPATSMYDVMYGYSKGADKKMWDWSNNYLGITSSIPLHEALSVGSRGSSLKNLSDISMLGISEGDKFARFVTAQAALSHWNRVFADKVASAYGLKQAYTAEEIIEKAMSIPKYNPELPTDALHIVEELNKIEPNLGNYYENVANFANRVVAQTQFVYSKAGRAPWLRDPITDALFGQFLSYSLSNTALSIDMTKQWVDSIARLMGDVTKANTPVKYMRGLDKAPKKLLTSLSFGGFKAVPAAITVAAVANMVNKLRTEDQLIDIESELAILSNSKDPTEQLVGKFLKSGVPGVLGYDVSTSFENDTENKLQLIFDGKFEKILAPFPQALFALSKWSSAPYGSKKSKAWENFYRSIAPSVALDLKGAIQLNEIRRNHAAMAKKLGKPDPELSEGGQVLDTILHSLYELSQKTKSIDKKSLALQKAYEASNMGDIADVPMLPTESDLIARSFGFVPQEQIMYREYIEKYRDLLEKVRSEKDEINMAIAHLGLQRFRGEIDQDTYDQAKAFYTEQAAAHGIDINNDTINTLMENAMSGDAHLERMLKSMPDAYKGQFLKMTRGYLSDSAFQLFLDRTKDKNIKINTVKSGSILDK